MCVLVGGVVAVGLQQKVASFVWEAVLGRVLTLDRFKRRGWIMLNRCYICNGEEESTDRLSLFQRKNFITAGLFSIWFGLNDAFYS